jgi:hypothetical protein
VSSHQAARHPGFENPRVGLNGAALKTHFSLSSHSCGGLHGKGIFFGFFEKQPPCFAYL